MSAVGSSLGRSGELARLLIITARSVMCGCERERERERGRGTERRGCSVVSAALSLSPTLESLSDAKK